MLVQRADHLEKEIDLSLARVFCGLHTIKMSVQVDKPPSHWGNLQPYYEVHRKPDGGLIFRRKVSLKLWPIRPNLRLAYNKASWLVIILEPERKSPNEYTDLLPFRQWDNYLDMLSRDVSEMLGYQRLNLHEARLGRFDVGFDFMCDDRSLLIESLRALPMELRLMKISTSTMYSSRFSTKTKSKALSCYDRHEKSGGNNIVRLEFRNLKKVIVDGALSLRGVTSSRACDLSDRGRLTHYIQRTLPRYGIHEGVDIVPLWIARSRIINRSLKHALDRYHDWTRKERSYFTRRLRHIENMVVGSVYDDSAVVKDLHASMMAAFEEAW